MDESCVLLVNLHQLLVSFVPHAGLRVCSHCNEVGYTLQRRNQEMIKMNIITNTCIHTNSSMLLTGTYLYRMDETLVERESYDVESKVPYAGLGVKECLQHLF